MNDEGDMGIPGDSLLNSNNKNSPGEPVISLVGIKYFGMNYKLDGVSYNTLQQI
jgi:hypothetical protein